MKRLSVSYLGAIEYSAEIADTGYGFARDADKLCENILDPQTATEEIQLFIKDMHLHWAFLSYGMAPSLDMIGSQVAEAKSKHNVLRAS